MLGVGRHQARRRLLQSGLPYRLISRHWRHPLDQSWYTRKCYAIPAKIVLALDSQQEERELLIMKRQLIRRGYKFSRQEEELLRELLPRPFDPATPRD